MESKPNEIFLRLRLSLLLLFLNVLNDMISEDYDISSESILRFTLEPLPGTRTASDLSQREH